MTRRKSLNIFDNGKIRNMIRVVLLVAIFLISDIKIFANNSVCEKIYSDCFYNIPKKMITYYKPYNKVGFVACMGRIFKKRNHTISIIRLYYSKCLVYTNYYRYFCSIDTSLMMHYIIG